MGEDDCQLRVSISSDDTLQLYARWPKDMNYPFQRHKLYVAGMGVNTMEKYHSRIQVYIESIDTIAVSVHEHRESILLLRLPFAVIPCVIEKHYLGQLSSTQCLLYCSMIASVEKSPALEKATEVFSLK